MKRKALALGSLNLDYVYHVSSIVKEGETVSVRYRETKEGGKGLNQAVALKKAGASTYMGGCVGSDGEALIDILRRSNVILSYLGEDDGPSGHAIIQVSDSGENAIIVCRGANGKITPEYVDTVLSHFDPGDYILLQNEISQVGYAIRKAKQQGMVIAFNPSPVTEELKSYPLDLVDILVLNELEGRALAGLSETDEYALMKALSAKYPQAAIVLTLGERGSLYHDSSTDIRCPAYDVPVVDTTGAGDTFCGYFLACTMKGMDPGSSLETASKAAAIAIGREGAAGSIPGMMEVMDSDLPPRDL